MIDSYSFGRIVIDETTYNQDLKLIKNLVISNWWRKNGHLVEPDDINDILKSGIEILILGRGDPGLMKATDGLKHLLEQKDIKLIEKPTAEAVTIYNHLFTSNKNIAAGFHLTC